ncbi:uncharacterized protein [Branchiostoma lanceolatum]|uniref:uncharacterized protein n=1 Tax=Branchiostoma lanceolatum TaxID=7740 RepID=UPI0034537895
MCGFAKSCKTTFHRSCLFRAIAITVAVAALFGLGMVAAMHLTVTSKSRAESHTPFEEEGPVFSSTSFIWKTASFAKASAPEPLLKTDISHPLTGPEVTTVVTTVLPEVTTLLPEVTTVLNQFPTVERQESPTTRKEDECQVEPYMRFDCGWKGITPDQCRQRGCCFDDSTRGAIWCFERTKRDCPIGDYIRLNGVCYKSFAEPKTREEASETCAEDGGMLAMPKDSVTNNFLPKLARVVESRWMGVTDANSDRLWSFEDGQDLMSSDYSNWCPGEPKQKNGRGGCAGFWGSGSCWGEKDCEWREPFICQLKPGRASRQYTSLGCWRDSYRTRAIPTLEGTDPRLDGNYRRRQNPTKKCYQVALSRGFTVFAVQNGGWCAGSADGVNTYDKYGPSTACNKDGEGWGKANEVYQITR